MRSRWRIVPASELLLSQADVARDNTIEAYKSKKKMTKLMTTPMKKKMNNSRYRA